MIWDGRSPHSLTGPSSPKMNIFIALGMKSGRVGGAATHLRL